MLSYSRNDTVLLVAIAANVCALLFGWTIVRKSDAVLVRGHIPTVGDELPLPSTQGILMTVEDTDHFRLFGERADSEWLAVRPENDGYVHFGEERRIFATALAHEMHCIRILRLAVATPMRDKAHSEHTIHCLNYLRQYALCNAGLTLEKFDPLESNFTSDRDHFGETHVCRKDWKVAYDEYAKKTKEWVDGGGKRRKLE